MKSVLLFVLFIFGPFGVHAQSGQEVRPVKRPRPESPASVPPTGTATRAVYKDPTWARPPKLVVGIVVDQMRVDYLYRYWDNFGPGGFKRLVGEGAFLRNVQYDYAPTHTAPGHASIYTGSTPMHHGIVANDMWIRSTGTPLYCVQDDAASGVGGEGSKGQRSPNNLLATTISDELERRTDGRSKTIGVAMKDRSSILPIGRTGDAAYWFFEGTEGHMATSTWYMTELPQWVKDFNARGLPQQYLK
ncbi:MAG TPA: alkaline phosphatase family protein, partial [Flavobacteriales bacterium]|nr:alkaline phosphatase family protein [Flavobacteriales bacterium]